MFILYGGFCALPAGLRPKAAGVVFSGPMWHADFRTAFDQLIEDRWQLMEHVPPDARCSLRSSATPRCLGSPK